MSCLLYSCNLEDTENTGKVAFPAPGKAVALRLNYELEAITTREYTNSGANENFKFLDDIGGETSANRQAIQIIAYQDGSADYLIEERPTERISLPSAFEGVPANDIPPITKTKISSGMAYF